MNQLNAALPQKPDASEAAPQEEDMRTSASFTQQNSTPVQNSSLPPQQVNQSQQLQGDLFGTSTNQQRVEAKIDPGSYTPLDKMPPVELDLFKNEEFEVFSVPMMPPPLELC